MGSPKVKQVGGGEATNTANAFNNFLLQGLTTGSFGNITDPRIQQAQNMINNQAQNSGIFGNIGKQIAQQGQKLQAQAGGGMPNSIAQSQGQTGLFGNTINSLLGGNPGDMINSNALLSGLSNINQNAPQFDAASLSQLGSNFNPNSLIGQFGDVFGGMQNTNFGDIVNSLKGLGLGGGGAGVGGDFSYKPGQLLNYDINSPEFQAIKDLSALRKKEDVANLRGRYGLVGGALSTGASNAEGQYLAQANPQEILALGQLGRQMQELDLGQQSINNQLRQGLLGQQVNAGLGAAGINAGNNQAMLGLLGNIYGQNLNYNLNRGNSLLGAGQNDIDNQLQAFLANSANQQTNNQNAFNQSQAQNQFNLNNFGQQSQNSLGLGQLGLGLQQLAQNGQLGILGQLFGAYGQSNQLGTAQRQIVTSPSDLSQGLGAITGIAGIVGGLATGNPLAALGGLGQLGSLGGGATSLGANTPFMNSNPGLFSGQNLGIGGYVPQNRINPTSLMAPTPSATNALGGPNIQTAFPNMMNSPGILQGYIPQFGAGLFR